MNRQQAYELVERELRELRVFEVRTWRGSPFGLPAQISVKVRGGADRRAATLIECVDALADEARLVCESLARSERTEQAVLDAGVAEPGSVVRFKSIVPGAVPFKRHESDAGWDLPCSIDEAVHVFPGHTVKLRSGIALAIPRGYFGCMRPRSSAIIRGLHIAGTVDSSYRGECYILATNIGDSAVRIEPGTRIAQVVITPVLLAKMEQCDDLDETARGDGAFGSSGGTV